MIALGLGAAGAAFAFLAACSGEVATSALRTTTSGQQEYRLHYEYGAIDSYAILQAALAEKAMELCPGGYLKTRETAEDRDRLERHSVFEAFSVPIERVFLDSSRIFGML